VKIDTAMLRKQSSELARTMLELERQRTSSPARPSTSLAAADPGDPVTKLQLPVLKKTPRASVHGRGLLEELALDYRCAGDLEHRSIAKLKRPMPTSCGDGERPHRAGATPPTTRRGRHRAAVVERSQPAEHPGAHRGGPAHPPGIRAGAGWTLLAADYSQIELRIMAHLSQTRACARRSPPAADVHRATARGVRGGAGGRD